MESATFARTGSRLAAARSGQIPQFRQSLRWFLGLACLAGAMSAQATNQDSDPGALPWVPEVIESIDPYVPQRLGLDHFAESSSRDQVGVYTAQLSNGNQVVAGLVPDGYGNTCSDGTARCSIGLVQYTPSGQRVIWPNAGSNGRYSNNYVVYPGGSQNRYQYIRDVEALNGYIYVLVDYTQNSGQLGQQDVYTVMFREDGTYMGALAAFGVGNNISDTIDFYGAALVPINNDRMMIVATIWDFIGPDIAVNRQTIQHGGAAEGTLTWDTSWGDPYAENDQERVIFYFAPGFYCGETSCKAIANSAAKQEGFATPTDFYVQASIQIDGDDWDVAAVKISSENGNLKPEFNGTGWSRVAFDDTNSNKRDFGAGIYVYQDEIWLAAQVAREYHPGIGLAKLDGATGNDNTAFGIGGKIIFGGQGHDDYYPSNEPDDDIPTMISATGGRIGVVGYHIWEDQGENTLVDPFLAVVNAASGTRLDFRDHPVRRPDGSRYGDAVFYGVYGGPSPGSPFTVSGNGRDASAGNTLSYLSGRLLPLSGDRIFANNFGIGDDYD